MSAKLGKKQKTLAEGRKPGSGRPLGSLAVRTKLIRARSDEEVRKGLLPIEVMLQNMRWFHQKAEDLLVDILEAQKKKQLSEAHIIALAKVYDFRAHAQKCAEGAAPYVHPRLSAIQVSGEVTQRHTLPDGLALAKAVEIYRESLKGRSASQMKTIDHQAANKDRDVS